MILINNNDGQLCNKLLLFANVYATAIETNHKVCHLYWKYNEKRFCRVKHNGFGYPTIRLGKFYVYYNKWIHNKRYKKYSYAERREIQNQKKRKIYAGSKYALYVVDDWYYRDYEALHRHRERIISAFRPTIETEKQINNYWEQLDCQPDTITVGIHMRRGDYKVWNNGIYYFSDDEYKKWMMDLAKELPHKICFVLSSNEEIHLENFESEWYSVYKAPGEQMEDLYTLARCDYIMGPPSTYSWWAAYYGDRKYLTLRSVNHRIHLNAFQKVKGEEFSIAYAENKGIDGEE